MTRKLSKSDLDRQSHLDHACRTGRADLERERPFLPAAFIAELEELHGDFSQNLDDLDLKLGIWHEAIAARVQASRFLAGLVRDIHYLFRRRYARQILSRRELKTYGIPRKAIAVNGSRSQVWITLAKRIQRGDDLYQETGASLLRDPSREDLARWQNKADQACLAVDQALKEVVAAQTQIRAKRALVDRGIRFMRKLLEVSLFDFDAAKKRKLLKRYGFIFKNRVPRLQQTPQPVPTAPTPQTTPTLQAEQTAPTAPTPQTDPTPQTVPLTVALRTEAVPTSDKPAAAAPKQQTNPPLPAEKPKKTPTNPLAAFLASFTSPAKGLLQKATAYKRTHAPEAHTTARPEKRPAQLLIN